MYGTPEEAAYIRSANEIIWYSEVSASVAGIKTKGNTKIHDIYPILGDGNTKSRSNCLVDWDDIDDVTKRELIGVGLYTEDGEPKGYNPHA